MTRPSFDEMHATSAGVREHYKTYDRWLAAQPPDMMKSRREEAEVIFRRVGITFAVYGDKDDGEGTEQAREHGAFTLDVDVLTRISAVLGIHQALGILFPQERLGVDWLRSPHNAVVFGGHPPLDLITNGSQDGLLSVRRFLDGARGGSSVT